MCFLPGPTKRGGRTEPLQTPCTEKLGTLIQRFDFSRKPNLCVSVRKWPESSPCPAGAALAQRQAVSSGKPLPIPHWTSHPTPGQWPSPLAPTPGPQAGACTQCWVSIARHPFSETRDEPGPLSLIPAQTCSQLSEKQSAGQTPRLSPAGHFEDHQRGHWLKEGLGTQQDCPRGPEG